VSLLVSELVTNAVIHGSQRPTDPIAMRVWTSPTHIRVEVGDRGGGFQRPSAPKRGEQRVDGWGLFLVERIADRFGMDRQRGNVVWFELEYPPAGYPSGSDRAGGRRADDTAMSTADRRVTDC
jgi:anti-sigma regulatory factor (Ser/Thr protein kinase)